MRRNLNLSENLILLAHGRPSSYFLGNLFSRKDQNNDKIENTFEFEEISEEIKIKIKTCEISLPSLPTIAYNKSLNKI